MIAYEQRRVDAYCRDLAATFADDPRCVVPLAPLRWPSWAAVVQSDIGGWPDVYFDMQSAPIAADGVACTAYRTVFVVCEPDLDNDGVVPAGTVELSDHVLIRAQAAGDEVTIELPVDTVDALGRLLCRVAAMVRES